MNQQPHEPKAEATLTKEHLLDLIQDPHRLQNFTLNQLRTQYPDMVAEVEQHLARERMAPDATVKLAADVQLQPGSTCGPFRVERLLGAGGMGTVYLATRKDDLHLKVALKTLYTWTPDMLSRFRSECQILSALRHSGIANLIDAGVQANGMPWLAMEYVEGLDLNKYLEQNKLSLEQRLNLFLEICDALNHAHQQMIIHRDLKPTNIMITDDGKPKLLDFGIAVNLDPLSGGHLTRSVPAEQMFTPQYASPEQIRGLRLSTASDIYSLGLLLYEMITGNQPYDVSTENPLTIADILLKTTITRPSTLVRRNKLLKKGITIDDLDTIVLKALAYEPADRYSSLEALMMDLRLYQQGLPIQARPATPFYRIRKFVMRNPVPVTASIALFLFLAIFGFTAAWQRSIITKERDRVAEEKQSAENITQFLVDMFEYTDPDLSKNGEVTAFEVMENGRRQMASILEDEPSTRLRLMTTMGRVYRKLGHPDMAQQLLEDVEKNSDLQTSYEASLELIHTLIEQGQYTQAEKRVLKMKNKFAQSKDQLAQTRVHHLQGLVYFSQGNYVSAQTAYEKAFSKFEILPIQEKLALLSDKASLLSELGYYEQAIEQLENLVQHQRDVLGTNHSQVAYTLTVLGEQHRQMGHYRKSLEVGRQAEIIYRKLYGDKHPLLARCLLYQGMVELEMEQEEKAEATVQKMLTMVEETLGPNHPLNADAFILLGNKRLEKGLLDEAEKLYRQALTIHTNHYGQEHPIIANAMNSLGNLFFYKGDIANAEAIYWKGLNMRLQLLGPNHPSVANSYNNLATLLAQRGQLKEATDFFEKAFAIRKESLGEDHPKVANLYNNLAALQWRLGEFKKAGDSLRQALAIIESHSDTKLEELQFRIYNNLAVMLRDQGQPTEVVSLYRKGLNLILKKHGPDHPEVATIRINMALQLLYLGHIEEAEALIDPAMKIREKHETPDNELASRSLSFLAKILILKGEYTQANALLDKAAVYYERNNEMEAPGYLVLLVRRGDAAFGLGELDKAYGYIKEAIDISLKSFDPRNKQMLNYYTRFLKILIEQKRFQETYNLMDDAQASACSDQNISGLASLWRVEAFLFKAENKPEEALEMLRMSSRVTWEMGDIYIIENTLLEMARLLAITGQTKEAATQLQKWYSVAQGYLPSDHESYHVAHSVEGQILFHDGSHKKGLRMIKDASLALASQLGENHRLTKEAKALGKAAH